MPTPHVIKYTQDINEALRQPVFAGKSADTLKIFRDFIEPFNNTEGVFSISKSPYSTLLPAHSAFQSIFFEFSNASSWR